MKPININMRKLIDNKKIKKYTIAISNRCHNVSPIRVGLCVSHSNLFYHSEYNFRLKVQKPWHNPPIFFSLIINFCFFKFIRIFCSSYYCCWCNSFFLYLKKKENSERLNVIYNKYTQYTSSYLSLVNIMLYVLDCCWV